jgi:hypothetical protein
MTYLVTGTNPRLEVRKYTIWDTVKEAIDDAEKSIKTGFTDIIIWEHYATPVVRPVIDWKHRTSSSHDRKDHP